MHKELRVVEALRGGLGAELGSREDGDGKESQSRTKIFSSIPLHYLSRSMILQWDHGNPLGSMQGE